MWRSRCCNTLATGATLVTLIYTFGPVSEAHFNPAVTLADASQGGIRWREVPAYVTAQCAGAVLGVWAAHLMFGEALLQVSRHARSGGAQVFSAESSVADRPDQGEARHVEGRL